MDKLILCLATLGPIGKKLPAPGTFGSLAGLLVFGGLMATQMGNDPMTLHITIEFSFVLLALLSVSICGQAERILAKEDPGEVILDEFVAHPWFYRNSFEFSSGFDSSKPPPLALGFVLFRFFGVLKPIGMRLQKLSGGLGVVADDIAAASAAGLCLWFLSITFPLSFP